MLSEDDELNDRERVRCTINPMQNRDSRKKSKGNHNTIPPLLHLSDVSNLSSVKAFQRCDSLKAHNFCFYVLLPTFGTSIQKDFCNMWD